MQQQDYKVLVANGTTNLASQVKLHLQEGWYLEGSVAIATYYDKNDKLVFQYVQSITRNEA